jgi:hypothetical protein
MKRKLISLVIFSLFATVTVSAQVRAGIRGGVNVSQLKSSDEITTGDYKITIPSYAMLGYHVGLVSQIQLFRLYIQPEVLYTVTRNDINIYDLNSVDPDDADPTTQKLNRLDFPVMLGFKSKVFKAGIGPVVTFLISDDSDLEKITDYDLRLNKASIGFQAGIGFDIHKVALDLKYEGSLSKLGDGIRIGSEKMAFDSRISQFIFSVGLFF